MAKRAQGRYYVVLLKACERVKEVKTSWKDEECDLWSCGAIVRYHIEQKPNCI